MRRFILILLSILVSLGFLYFVLRDVPLAEVWEQLQQANLLWVFVTFVISFLGLWFRAWRWRDLLDYKIGQKDAFYIIGVTFLLNQLPLRAGEVARSVLARRHDVPMVTAATSIVVERLLDTVFVVLLLAWALANVPNVPPEVNQTASLFGALATGGFLVLIAFAHVPQLARGILKQIITWIPFLERLPLPSMLDNVLVGLAPLTQWRKLASAITLTLISWALSLLSIVVLHFALNITDVDIVLSTALGASLASFSVAIPVSVASIGPFQAALVITGQMVNMSEIQAVALGLLFHGTAVASYILWGVVGLLALGVNFSDLQGKSQEKTPQTETSIS